MTRTIQSRVIALVGVGVFAAGAALALLSRDALLHLERTFRASQERLASVLAAALSEDLLFDEQLMQGAADAPYVNPSDADDTPERRALAPTLRASRLASVVCFASSRADIGSCEPAMLTPRLAYASVHRQISTAMSLTRPLISPLLPTGDTDAILIVIPIHGDAGTAQGAIVELIDPRDRRLLTTLRSAAALDDGSGGIIAPGGGLDLHEGTVAAAVPGTPWRIQVPAVTDDAVASIAAFRRTSLWLAPALAAIATLLAWGVAGSVRRPIGDLVRAAERIAGGNLDERIPPGSADEIGRLAASLEDMRRRIKELLDAKAAWSAELEHRVEQRTRELRRLTRQVISAQEDERRRVARELHDETSQLVAAIGMRLDSMAGTALGEDRARLMELRALVDRMHDGLHRLIVNLRPSVLDDLGLAAAIQWLGDQQLARGRVTVKCELRDLQEVRLAPDAAIAVFRIVQEAVANVARHADADSILIQGSIANGHVMIEVEDDGLGFDPSRVVTAPDSLMGVGLLGMRERAEIVGGSLSVDSAPGQGTRVVVSVPLAPEYEVVA